MNQKTHTLYGDHRSGNCYKVALLMRLLGMEFNWRETDVLKGTTRTDSFLAMNPHGRVPLLVLPDGRHLAESNAMLLHLSENSAYLPVDSYERALVYQWLFFEQYSHEPYIAVARFLLHFDHGQPIDPDRMSMLADRGNQALQVMNQVLSEQRFFAGDGYSIADIALFAYTHVAADGHFDLSAYPNILDWLERVRAQPGHFDMQAFVV